MKRPLILTLAGIGFLLSGVVPFGIAPRHSAPLSGIRLLDQRQLDWDRIGGHSFHEISDLAYDPAAHTLWMLSDKGRLFRFEARFDQQIHLKPLGAVNLTDARGKRLPKALRDSEGLCLDGDGRLSVSFEGRPRVARLSPGGVVSRPVPLPKPLRSLKHYRGSNQGLESLAWHPQYGFLTVKERPPKGHPKTDQTLYALDGHRWRFRSEDLPDNGVTAVEVMEDGHLLVLERSFDKKNLRIVITLKKLFLDTPSPGETRTRILARLSTDDGWILDNFEGLARVAPRRYVMISDDGNHPLEKTLLLYFEVKD